ncbi:FCD domain-containing protein, partial [Pseudomonas aeruginosa]|uniref:FCD domain-containing protein n=3 Tax=Pseudomonas TaxID=286 RepID=UPI0021F16222
EIGKPLYGGIQSLRWFLVPLLPKPQFHYALTTIARMPVLAGLLDSLWMRTGPLIARAYGNFNERMAIDHHWEVLDALKRRDGAAARAAICRDILDGNEKMLEYIEMAQAD